MPAVRLREFHFHAVTLVKQCTSFVLIGLWRGIATPFVVSEAPLIANGGSPSAQWRAGDAPWGAVCGDMIGKIPLF